MGLEPISGIEGQLRFRGTWPDSIQAGALIVLDGLDPVNFAAHFVSYGDPVLPGDSLSYYFFQLPPGFYFLAAVGLTMDPVAFFMDLDSILAAPHLPLVVLEKDPPPEGSVRVREREVTAVDQQVIF